MKTFLLLALVAVAAATKIELESDLLESANLGNSAQQATYQKHYTKHGGRAHDHTFSCAYNHQDLGKKCNLPTARAYDHHDKSVTLSKEYFVVERDGTVASAKGIFFDKGFVHKTQIIKYNAVDYAGNAAPTVVVAFYVWDPVKPDIFVCRGDNSDTYEATHANYRSSHYPSPKFPSPFKGCLGSDATYSTDAVDGARTVTATIMAPGGYSNLWNSGIKFDTVGRWTVRYTSSDKSSNVANAGKDVTIQDTQNPVIHVTGSNEIFECHQTNKYNDKGAVCTDRLDGSISIAAIKDSAVDETKEGLTTLTYDCQDKHNHNAVQKKRTVTVQDTTAPTLTINGAATVQFYAGEANWMPFSQMTAAEKKAVSHSTTGDANSRQSMGSHYKQGALDLWATCTDECVGTTITHSFQPSWNHMKPDTYVETYHCRDHANTNNHAPDATRTINLLDKHQPIMRLNGKNPHTYEAYNGGKYTDAGAICTDEIDGDLTADVVVSGDKVVNLSEPGTYYIKYNCKDSHNNQGDELTRAVIVQDTIKPVLYMNSNSFMVIEGSFPYQDPGATAYDSLDGDLTNRIKSNAKDVNVNAAAHTGNDFTSGNGLWKIHYNVADDVGNKADTICRTVVLKDTLPPIITFTRDGKTYGHTDVKFNTNPIKRSYSDKDYYKDLRQRTETTGVKGVGNKVQVADTHTQFYAPQNGYIALSEQQSTGVNGWVIGAVASAVTGLALLGMSMKKRNGYAAVPV